MHFIAEMTCLISEQKIRSDLASVFLYNRDQPTILLTNTKHHATPPSPRAAHPAPGTNLQHPPNPYQRTNRNEIPPPTADRTTNGQLLPSSPTAQTSQLRRAREPIQWLGRIWSSAPSGGCCAWICRGGEEGTACFDVYRRKRPACRMD